MTPERFERVEHLFDAASALESPEARAALLERECAGDEELLAEVRSLLSAAPTATQRLGSIISFGAALAQERRIGPYRIVESVAGGGMGSVWRAIRDDGQYEKDVAVKLIRDALVFDEHFVQRFLEERQILARMEHPNIARLLDGGVTPDQVPYLVMEFVVGLPITDFCTTRALPLDARLRLFRQVCSAVHYAHRNLVVHRDLKPGNILVTPDGTVKLLDFGVAKALDSGRDLTSTGARLMTLDYASPEQARGEAVTTATDIYSLGLLLYELLSGRRAQRCTSTSPADILRVICEVDPPPPGGPADAANIVMKAIRKNPAERYATVEQLSEDVGRYLDGQPVAARPATLGYLAGKFVRRHKAPVALAAGVAAALVLGGVLTFRQARIAERRFDLVRGMANSVLFEVDPALEAVPGSTPARKIIIDRASNYLDRLSQDAAGDRGLQMELAAAYEKLAGVMGNPNLANLGDLPGAAAAYEKALRIRRQLVAAEPTSAEQRSLLAANKAATGILESERGETAKGRALLTEAVGACQGIELTSPETARRLGLAHLQLARLTSNRSNVQRSFESYSTALRIVEDAARKFPRSDFRHEIALAYAGVARASREASKLPQALAYAEKALALRETLAATRPTPDIRRELLMAHQTIADVLGAPGQFSLNRTAEAKSHYEHSLALAEELAAADPRSYRAQRDLMVALNRLGDVVEREGGKKTALAMFERALKTVAALEANDHRPPVRLDLASSMARVGDRYVAQGRREEGFELNRRAIRLRESVVADDPANVEAKRHVMLSAASFGDDLRQAGRLAEAELLLRQSLSMAETLSKADPSDALSNRYVAVASELVGGVLFDQRRYAEACPHYERALTVIKRVNAAGVAVDSDAEGIKVLERELGRCLAARDK